MVKNYFNGNYFVSLDTITGTKIYRGLRVGEELISDFPDSLDLKITNICNHGCPWCHENSTNKGKSFNVDKTIKMLDSLPKVGIELAIGGGDVEECGDDLIKLLTWANENSFQPRLTLNYRNFSQKPSLVEDYLPKSDFNLLIGDLIGGMGISIENDVDINILKDRFSDFNYPIVFHVIAGMFPVKKIKDLLENGQNVLILGFKSWGRGAKIENPVTESWKSELKRLIYKMRSHPFKGVMSFDNLGIDQLDIRSSFLNDEWETLYMGDDFTHTMYVDAVEETFAPTSSSPNRVSWDEGNIVEFFKKYKNDKVLQ